MPEQLQTVLANLRAFGPQKLMALGAVGLLVMAVIGVAAVYLNKPAYETLYVGLDRSDVNQIGVVLGESGIDFDVGSEGSSVLVPAGRTAQARMLLAEKGLPTSSNAGYELFDQVGSLGLTSFMQQVTRVRALEGEIARSIQSINGIKSARVHIVMSERANFRREAQEPSASVVIRGTGMDANRSALAIRHMVAAAVPGLNAEKVTVMDSTGVLLAAGDDPSNNSANRAIGVERTVESQIEDSIHRALAPYLGADNFRASVRATVNTDQRQTEETIFDPESRVERSVQVVRSNDLAKQSSASEPATVEQALPEEDVTAEGGTSSSEQRERREETTNYELNTKRIATVSNGYAISRLSVAVVVNEARIKAILGEGATPEQVEARVEEIRTLVTSAAGLEEARGDAMSISAVEFIEEADAVEAGGGALDFVSRHVGTMINAGAFVLVAFLVVWFGLRPLVSTLGAKPESAAKPSFDEVQRSLPNPGEAPQLPGGQDAQAASANQPSTLDELRRKIRPAPQDRLVRMIDLNEERTAQILRKWAHQAA
ncbi:MAG: flagellar M-ring protein FliF [Rhizobiaceae bacterium]|nr:flagellar M-ring protein FliF [Rhizobiaceae bacterium]MCV0407012.1 flagellar M-ring protein FliF [Rhizobiaceae bacterium]